MRPGAGAGGWGGLPLGSEGSQEGCELDSEGNCMFKRSFDCHVEDEMEAVNP